MRRAAIGYPFVPILLAFTVAIAAADEPGSSAAEKPIPMTAPVRIDELSENWRYARDADKVPVIRAYVGEHRKKLRLAKQYDTPYCHRFMEDFLVGNFQVIEPAYQALFADDPRLGDRPVQDLQGGSVRRLPEGDPRLGWHRCGAVDFRDTDLPPEREGDFFRGPEWLGGPPYRIYRVEVDGDPKNGPEDVILAREKVNGWQRYAWVDLKRCETKYRAQIGTWFKKPGREHPEPLGLLIRYRGHVAILSYVRDANSPRGDPSEWVQFSFDRLHPRSECIWATRFPGER